MTDACVGELKKKQDAKNFLSFFGLTPETAEKNVLVVDRGFEGANEKYITLVAPKGKKKTKEKGKTRVAKQHTAK